VIRNVSLTIFQKEEKSRGSKKGDTIDLMIFDFFNTNQPMEEGWFHTVYISFLFLDYITIGMKRI
jgi:hypothetical protein